MIEGTRSHSHRTEDYLHEKPPHSPSQRMCGHCHSLSDRWSPDIPESKQKESLPVSWEQSGWAQSKYDRAVTGICVGGSGLA